MNDHAREKIEALGIQNTRQSKHKAEDLRNSAFAAYLVQTSFHKQSALACLKSPSATVHTLLQAWTRYMRSPEHEKEKARSQRINPEDEEAVNQKKTPSGIENAGAFTEAPAPRDEKRECSKN